MPGDIFKCTGCGAPVHIDSAEHCHYCEACYCGACSGNTTFVHDAEEGDEVVACKECASNAV